MYNEIFQYLFSLNIIMNDKRIGTTINQRRPLIIQR